MREVYIKIQRPNGKEEAKRIMIPSKGFDKNLKRWEKDIGKATKDGTILLEFYEIGGAKTVYAQMMGK
jgi:hypothetical protein